jgi:hypothetical protein
MHNQNMRWVNWTARAYYVVGTIYYVYHWVLIVGAAGLTTAAVLSWRHAPPVVSSAITTVSIVAIMAGISFWRRIVRIQLASQNPGLRVKGMKVDYHYRSPTECDCFRTLRVKALHSVDHYRARFKWSSEGTLRVEVMRGAKNAELSDHSVSLFNMCQINFERPLTKNEEAEFSYKLSLQNADKPIKLYLGHTVDAPIRELRLKVRLPANYAGKQFRKQMFMNPAAETPLKEEMVPISQAEHEIEWYIPNAQAGYYYCIRW